MINEEEMEMPTPCQYCGEWFDLHDGVGSEVWYPGTVICEECGKIEEQLMQVNDDIDQCNAEIDDAEWTIKEQRKSLEILLITKAQLDEKRSQQIEKKYDS